MNLRIQTGVILLSRVIFNVFSSDDFSSIGFPVDETANDSDEAVFTETKIKCWKLTNNAFGGVTNIVVINIAQFNQISLVGVWMNFEMLQK